MAAPKPTTAAQPPTRSRPPLSGDAPLEVRFLQSVFAEISGSSRQAPQSTVRAAARGAAKDGEPRR
jgi:hypothetical protein